MFRIFLYHQPCIVFWIRIQILFLTEGTLFDHPLVVFERY